jgi:hypothetical protein
MRRIQFRRPSHATVVAYLALFVALGGGTTAVALSGTNTVQSDDLGPGAQVRAPDVADNAVGSRDVINESLTGRDIKNQSRVDTCVSTVRLGQVCVRAENSHRQWLNAAKHCANLDLRLPTFGEALELAQTHDIPNVDELEDFWTQDRYRIGDFEFADRVGDDGTTGVAPTTSSLETVCVTTPTN